MTSGTNSFLRRPRKRAAAAASALLALAFACDRQPEIEPEQSGGAATGGGTTAGSGGTGATGAQPGATGGTATTGGAGGSGAETVAGGATASGGSAGSGAASQADAVAPLPEDLVCPSGLPGPALVRMQTPDGVVFCMDQREVIWRDYRLFLTAKGADTAGQPSECSWNTTFEPEYQVGCDDTCDEFDPRCPDGSQPTSEDTPANCLDFCDAAAYCHWAGKRLCGRVGGGMAGRIDVALDDRNATTQEQEALSQLVRSPEMEFGYACTQGGKTLYAYGDTYEPGRCIDSAWVEAKGTSSLEVADLSTRACHGTEPPFDQIYDLSGSVEERQNLCSVSIGGGVGCLQIGGTTDPIDATRQACAADAGFSYFKHKNPTIGFRCCADGVTKVSSGL